MSEIVKMENVRNSLVSIRNQYMILASEVAKLYNVETKAVNQAVKNNPEKFPDGYVYQLTKDEWNALRSKFLTLESCSGRGKYPKYLPKAFTEKGLYMLATILKGRIATQTTLAIIDTFAEVRELKRSLLEMHDTESQEEKRSGMARIGDILAELIMPDADTTETQSSLEFNFVFGKLKHSVTRQRKSENQDIILREKVAFAKRLLAKGIPDEEVIELSGLSDKEIKRLEDLREENV